VPLPRLHRDPDTPSDPGPLVWAINRSLRMFAGMCPIPMGNNRFGDEIQCGLVLYAEEDQPEVTCPRCRATVNVERNRQSAVMDRDLLDAARLIDVMHTLGEPVCKERISAWLKAGRLTNRRYVHAGRVVEHRIRRGDAALYSLSQARQLRWHDEKMTTMAPSTPCSTPPPPSASASSVGPAAVAYSTPTSVGESRISAP
jgi:hypothetical protein